MLTSVGALMALLALQLAPAGLTGVVRDELTGAPLPGAVVALPELERSAVAGPDGRYDLAAVPPGPQHLAVRSLGYAPRTLHALVPAEGVLEIGITLRAEPVRLRTIEVRPRPAIPGLEPDSATAPDRALTMAAIRNHPLLAEPDAFRGLGGGEVVHDPESPSGLHVRGAAADQVGYLLDGIPVLSPYHSAGGFAAWNPDALAGVGLSATAPSPAAPDALAGIVHADTRAPGTRHSAQGSLGATGARLTLDGPLGPWTGGYLVSGRAAFPGSPAAPRDPSYLRSDAGDWLAKIEAPVAGGRLRLLGYGNANDLSAASGEGDGTGPRHRFHWRSRSYGVDWERRTGAVGLRLTAWTASAHAAARWAAAAAPLDLRSERVDWGLVLQAEHGSAHPGAFGLRLERHRTAFEASGGAESGTWSPSADRPTVAAFVRQQRALGGGVVAAGDLLVGADPAGLHALPRLRLTWRPAPTWTVTAAAATFRQAEQSLRNPESLIGQVFPADLFVAGGELGPSSARARQLVIAADHRLTPAVRIGAQAYVRAARGLLLAAPRTGAPFATDGAATGSAASHGVAVTAAARGARGAVTAAYGFQHVRHRAAGAAYVPAAAATHHLDLGVVAFPTTTLAVKLGAAMAAGRRGTAVSGPFEWEACNLLDRGCELVGTPDHTGQPIGARTLPGYVRVDLSVRQHWHLEVAGRDASVSVFATVTNLFGRRNVLTYILDPATGAAAPVDMRPFAPLVLGLDWRL